MPREHAAGLAELLALVVFTVGHWPAQTLVAVGEVDRDGCLVLLDLPEGGDVGGWLTLTTTLGHRLRVQGQSRAMLFLFGDADPGAGPSDAARRALSGVAQSLVRDHGIAVDDSCLVGPTAYRSLLCGDGCCPPAGDLRRAAEVSQVAGVLTAATPWVMPRSAPAPAAPMRPFVRYAGYAVPAVFVVGWVLKLLGS